LWGRLEARWKGKRGTVLAMNSYRGLGVYRNRRVCQDSLGAIRGGQGNPSEDGRKKELEKKVRPCRKKGAGRTQGYGWVGKSVVNRRWGRS